MAKKNGKRLLRLADHQHLADLEVDLASATQAIAPAKVRLADLEREVAEQDAAVERCERRILAGRDTDANLAVEQDRLINAKRARAEADMAVQDLEKRLERLPHAIEIVKQEAKAEIAANRRADFALALKDLRDKLAAAQAASDEVQRQVDEAHNELPMFHSDRFNANCHDAGAAGLIVPGAGLRNVTPSFLSHHGYAGNQPGVVATLAEIDALLDALPAMAEGDIKRKAARMARDAERAAENERKLAHMAEVDRRHRERYGW